MPGNLEGSLLLQREALQGNINSPTALLPFVFSLSSSLPKWTSYTLSTYKHKDEKSKLTFFLWIKLERKADDIELLHGALQIQSQQSTVKLPHHFGFDLQPLK